MTSDDPAGAIDMNASRPYRRFACQTCGYVYDEEQGDPAAGLAPGTPGTRWEGRARGLVLPRLRHAQDRFRAGVAVNVVVVGAGVAGVSVAESLAASVGWRVTLVTSDTWGYIARPRLSHGVALGDEAAQKIVLKRFDAFPSTIDVRAGAEVVRIDREAHRSNDWSWPAVPVRSRMKRTPALSETAARQAKWPSSCSRNLRAGKGGQTLPRDGRRPLRTTSCSRRPAATMRG